MPKTSLFLRRFGTGKLMPLFQREEVGEPLQLVDRVEDTDFVVIPHTVRRISKEYAAHIEETRSLAASHGKQTILFLGGDYSDRLHVKDAIVFKPSLYAHGRIGGEYAAPSSIKDLSKEAPLTWRHKSERPIVGFCGYAGFPRLTTQLKYYAKNAAIDLASAVSGQPHLRAHKRGIYFRRTALAALAGDARINTCFVTRQAFFNQVGGDKQQMRREYVDNMQHADFVLCPKGDGNYSIRFYEALSLGRIPVLIDTDMVLPLEGTLNYAEFILRVPHTELARLPDRIVKFYDSLTDEQFVLMQQCAREAFEHYLNHGIFFNRAFALLKEKGSEVL